LSRWSKPNLIKCKIYQRSGKSGIANENGSLQTKDAVKKGIHRESRGQQETTTLNIIVCGQV